MVEEDRWENIVCRWLAYFWATVLEYTGACHCVGVFTVRVSCIVVGVSHTLDVDCLPRCDRTTFPFDIVRAVNLKFRTHRRRRMISTARVTRRDRTTLREIKVKRLRGQAIASLSNNRGRLIRFTHSLIRKAPLVLLSRPATDLSVNRRSRLVGMLRGRYGGKGSTLITVRGLGATTRFYSHLVLVGRNRIVTRNGPGRMLDRRGVQILCRSLIVISRRTVAKGAVISPCGGWRVWGVRDPI